MGKGDFTKKIMVAVRNYRTNTIMEKKQTEAEGGRVKDNEFSGVK